MVLRVFLVEDSEHKHPDWYTTQDGPSIQARGMPETFSEADIEWFESFQATLYKLQRIPDLF